MTRLSDGFCNAQDYYEVRGPSHKGSLGCAIWVARSSPLGAVDKRHIKVLFAEPRLLIARLNAPNLSCYLISAHAPHSGNAAEVLQSWWEAAERQIRKACTGRLPILTGIDANAQVGQITSILPLAATRPTSKPKGENFYVSFAIPNHCVPPPLLREPPEKQPTKTRRHTLGSPPVGATTYRLDYVLVPQGLLPAVRKCRVHHDFDDGGPDDHFPASVALSLAGLPEGEPTYEYPRIGLRTVEDVRAPFLAVCRDEACMPWTANVHQQVANFDQAFWHACGRRPSKPTAHRAYVNEDLWKLIRQRKVLLGQIRQAGLQQDRCC